MRLGLFQDQHLLQIDATRSCLASESDSTDDSSNALLIPALLSRALVETFVVRAEHCADRWDPSRRLVL
jgi:hypothetical protein